MSTISFTEQETEKIKEAIELYKFVKETTILNETIDSNLSTRTDTMHELVKSYDRLNKVVALKLNEERADSQKIRENLDKMLSHIYNVAACNIEWLHVEVKYCVKNNLFSYSNKAIKECVPDYYDVIKPRLIEYQGEISKLVSTVQKGEIRSDNFEKMKEFKKKLLEIRKKIIISLGSFKEFELKEKRESSEKEKNNFKFVIAATIIGAVIAAALEQYLIIALAFALLIFYLLK